MSLITKDMTTEAVTLFERLVRHCADTTALVEDVKAFSLRRCENIPEGISLQAQDELGDWTAAVLGVDEMCGLLDAAVATIVSYHDSGQFEPFSEAEITERHAMAQLALSALESDSTEALVSAN